MLLETRTRLLFLTLACFLSEVIVRVNSSYPPPPPSPHPPSCPFSAAPFSNPVSFTVKQIRETLDSIKVEDVRPLVSRIFEEAEGISLMQGNLREADVPR